MNEDNFDNFDNEEYYNIDDTLDDTLDDNNIDNIILDVEPKKRKKNPVDDTEFTHEILLSKGLGTLTRKSEKIIIILVENAIKKTYYKFDNQDDINDSIQTSYYNFLKKWQGFNPEIASSAFTYFTEIHKRSGAEFMNMWKKLRGIKKEDLTNIKRISINSSNNGKGIFNI